MALCVYKVLDDCVIYSANHYIIRITFANIHSIKTFYCLKTLSIWALYIAKNGRVLLYVSGSKLSNDFLRWVIPLKSPSIIVCEQIPMWQTDKFARIENLEIHCLYNYWLLTNNLVMLFKFKSSLPQTRNTCVAWPHYQECFATEGTYDLT